MKKILCLILAVITVTLFAGCSLFSNDNVVKFGEIYTHTDPDGIEYDERIVLKKDGFEAALEDGVNSMAYPDTLIYDADGNITGMYDYDSETGYATGMTDFSTGEHVDYAEGEEVFLGLPDESLMIDIPGTATLGFVVYGKGEETVGVYTYLFLDDKSAADVAISAMSEYCGVELSAESDTVLKNVMDKDGVTASFDEAEAMYGETFDTKDAETYAGLLKDMYGVTEYTGESAYEPYAGHTDPTDIDFDERAVLVGPGEYAVYEDDVDKIASLTDYVYAKDGEVVAHYEYFEFVSKEACDAMMARTDGFFTDPTRVSDTVIQDKFVGQDLEDILESYLGYNLIKDKSLDEYATNLAESYFSTRCE